MCLGLEPKRPQATGQFAQSGKRKKEQGATREDRTLHRCRAGSSWKKEALFLTPPRTNYASEGAINASDELRWKTLPPNSAGHDALKLYQNSHASLGMALL